jgi:serine/threonine-protein kinase
VGLHDCGEFEGDLRIPMDFVDGSDAARLLAELPHRVWGPAAWWRSFERSAKPWALRTAKVCYIVASNRRHPPQHGYGSTTAILLADFGISLEIGFSSGLTETNMTVGTVNYTAPKQLMANRVGPLRHDGPTGATSSLVSVLR